MTTPTPPPASQPTPRTQAAFSAMLDVLARYDKKEVYFSDVANVFYLAKCDVQNIERELSLAIEIGNAKITQAQRSDAAHREAEIKLAALRAQLEEAKGEKRDKLAMSATEADLEAIIPRTTGECSALFHELGFGPKPEPQDLCRYMVRHDVNTRLRYWARYRHADKMLAAAQLKAASRPVESPTPQKVPAGELFDAADKLNDYLLEISNWPMKDIPDEIYGPFAAALKNAESAPPATASAAQGEEVR